VEADGSTWITLAKVDLNVGAKGGYQYEWQTCISVSLESGYKQMDVGGSRWKKMEQGVSTWKHMDNIAKGGCQWDWQRWLSIRVANIGKGGCHIQWERWMGISLAKVDVNIAGEGKDSRYCDRWERW
jgi:hypothetical protein